MWHFHCVKGISVCGKHLQTDIIFVFSVPLLNKRSTKFYTTSCDAPWCSVATSFQSTLKFNILCKYIQNNSIHHMELIYVERQTDRQNGIITDGDHRYWWNVCGLTSGSSFIEENDIAIGSTSSFICTASPTIFTVMTSLLSPEDCTLASPNISCSTLSPTLQLWKTNVPLSVICALWPTATQHPPPPTTKKKERRRHISFYAMVLFLKNVQKIK